MREYGLTQMSTKVIWVLTSADPSAARRYGERSMVLFAYLECSPGETQHYVLPCIDASKQRSSKMLIRETNSSKCLA